MISRKQNAVRNGPVRAEERRDEKALDELGYQKQQDRSGGPAVSSLGASCPQEGPTHHACTGIKDRLKGAAFNEGFISAFRISILGWIVSATGRSICIRQARCSAIVAIAAKRWKQITTRPSDWLNFRYKIVKNLTEFRQFCHVWCVRVTQDSPSVVVGGGRRGCDASKR